MVYADSFDLTKVYWEKYLDIYLEVYRKVAENMNGLFDDEVAKAAAINTAMIAFTKAAGMDMTGVVSWDESLAGETPDFVSFASPKKAVAPTGGSFVKTNVSSASANSAPVADAGGYQKKTYDGPKQLTGPVSEKQVQIINGFLNGNNEKVRAVAEETLADLNVASPEEMSKQDASVLIDKCFKMSSKGPRKY
jgi:hypothetical protein